MLTMSSPGRTKAMQDELPREEMPESPGVVPRPPSILMELSYEFRWEVTRRHPYYLRYWQLAQQYYQQPSTDLAQKGWQKAAVLILQAIGVSGLPPSPSASAASLCVSSLAAGWESGAVAPVTLRGLAGLLLMSAPPDLCAGLSEVFLACGSPSDDLPQQRWEILQLLRELRHPALDHVPSSPVVGINAGAPQRVIVKAVESLVRGWKEQRGIPERRRREDKVSKYLAIWDQREGWLQDHYDGGQEKTLRRVAQQARISLATAANRYRSAFRLIVGHEYSPSLWAHIMGLFKVSEWLDPSALPKRTLHRPWRQKQRPLILESVLQASGQGRRATGLLNAAYTTDDLAFTDLLLDVQELLQDNLSNAEIASRLGVSHEAVDALIELLRERNLDTL